MPALTQSGAPRLTLNGRALALDAGLKLACPPAGASCTVTLVVTMPAAGASSKSGKRRSKARNVTLGRVQLVVSAGRSEELTLRLGTGAAKLLAAKHRLRATLAVKVTSGQLPAVTASRALSLASPPAKRAHH